MSNVYRDCSTIKVHPRKSPKRQYGQTNAHGVSLVRRVSAVCRNRHACRRPARALHVHFLVRREVEALEFLSSATVRVSELGSEEEILRFVAQSLVRLVPETM